MKKNILFILLSVVFSLSYSQPFRFAGTLGYVNSKLQTKVMNANIDFEPQSGIYLGIQGEYFFNNKFSAQLEWEFATLGAGNVPSTVDLKDKVYEGNLDLGLVTTSFPIGIKFYPSEKIALLGGLRLGMISIASAKIEGEVVRFPNIEKASHFFFFGGECRVYRDFFIEARYNFGVSEIYTATRNNYLQIGLGWYFDKL